MSRDPVALSESQNGGEEGLRQLQLETDRDREQLSHPHYCHTVGQSFLFHSEQSQRPGVPSRLFREGHRALKQLTCASCSPVTHLEYKRGGGDPLMVLLLLLLPQTSQLPPSLWREKGAWHKAEALKHRSSRMMKSPGPCRTVSLPPCVPVHTGVTELSI